jgi:hypothetical protein
MKENVKSVNNDNKADVISKMGKFRVLIFFSKEIFNYAAVI